MPSCPDLSVSKYAKKGPTARIVRKKVLIFAQHANHSERFRLQDFVLTYWLCAGSDYFEGFHSLFNASIIQSLNMERKKGPDLGAQAMGERFGVQILTSSVASPASGIDQQELRKDWKFKLDGHQSILAFLIPVSFATKTFLLTKCPQYIFCEP